MATWTDISKIIVAHETTGDGMVLSGFGNCPPI